MLIEITIIIILCTFQSLFGVGLLLFGTPTFLLLGYSFVETLIFLLPISIIISFLQIIYNNNLNKKNSKEFIIYCIPFLVFFLILSNINNLIDIKIIVSSLLIISSIISLNFTKVYKFKFFVKKYKKICISFIGIVHGFSNMGGGFLSIFSAIINDKNKFNTRSYIAYGYLVMGVIQFAIIILIEPDNLVSINWFYLILPIIIFYPVQICLKLIDDSLFNKIIVYVALIYGTFTLLMSLK